MAMQQEVAEIVTQSLYNAGVRVVFGIPGAKIDALFNCLLDHAEIKLITCRHEQNAAFMAAAVGRITGIPGVAIVTSGPGAGNLTTGLVTATTEGDPVIAILGSVPRLLSTKHTHQSMRALDILGPTAKSAIGVDVEDQTAEIILQAFRTASTNPKGSSVVSIPMDIAGGKSSIGAFAPAAFTPPNFGPAASENIRQVARMVENAKLPVLFLGQRAGSPRIVEALRRGLHVRPIAVVETFQAAGAVSQDLEHLFFGRVGLFRNQPGDRLLARSDLVISIGYDPAEYDASAWNPSGDINVVHIDSTSCDYGAHYKPTTELLGSVRANVIALFDEIQQTTNPAADEFCRTLSTDLRSWRSHGDYLTQADGPVQPLHFVSALQKRVSKDTTVSCDVGTVYIYMMRYFRAYEPRKLLCSNGQQTLGVGLPWAIAASLVQQPPCSQKVVSLSGDGGFMFSSQEISTAVQQDCNITHFIWNDSAYNMVQFQEELKYGRSSGIALGGVDFVKFAESFGGKGFKMNRDCEIEQVMDQALAHNGLSLVDVRIDYSQSKALAEQLREDGLG